MKTFMTIIASIFTLSISAMALDINTASQTQLEGLHGVGATKAKKIVEYRDSIKCFEKVEDLTLVSGIGNGILEKNKEMLTASNCDEHKKKMGYDVSMNTKK